MGIINPSENSDEKLKVNPGKSEDGLSMTCRKLSQTAKKFDKN
jgi:hypothetical protein